MAKHRRTRKRPSQQALLHTEAAGVVKQVETWLESSTALVIREADNLEAVESALLEARFAGSPDDVAASYLYLIPPREDGKRPGIVGPNVDFVNQMVRLLNATQRTRMTIADEPPLFEDATTADGKPAIRVVVKAVDRATGDVRWGVKVEAKSQHADTIALVKAQKKALESLPNYDRRTVAHRIVRFLRDHEAELRAHGIEPRKLVVAGMGAVSQWSDLFARAKEAGIKPDQVRAAVRQQTGKGLSEVKTAQEVARATAAADRVIAQAPLFTDQLSTPARPAQAPPAVSSPPPSPEDAAERDRLLHGVYDCLTALQTSAKSLTVALKVQFGAESVEALTLPQLRTFHQQLQRRLPLAGRPS